MRSIKLAGFAALVCAVTGAHQVQAADVLPPPDASDWTFTGAAYLWGSGIDGHVGAFGFQPQHINASFGDILGNLQGAFMGLGEARKGPFSIGTDIAYARLGMTVQTPFRIKADSVDITASSLMATGVVGYALLDSGSSHIDAVAGARVWSVTNDLHFKGGTLDGQSASDGATWVDPLVGAKFKADLGSNFSLSGWGMIGGFGVSSKLMWDVMGGVGYDVTKSFSVFGGYRAVSVDYSHNGFVYDVVQQGPIFAGVYHF